MGRKRPRACSQLLHTNKPGSVEGVQPRNPGTHPQPRGQSPAPCPRGDADRTRGQCTAWCGTWAGSSPHSQPQLAHGHTAGPDATGDGAWIPARATLLLRDSPKAPKQPAQPSPRDSPACTAWGEAGEHHPCAPARARVEGHHTECWASTGLALFGMRMA